MKIALITNYTPTIDNYNGPSSLCFYLLLGLSNSNEIKVFTTNSNKVPKTIIQEAEKKIGIKYVYLIRNIWQRLLLSKKTGFLFTPYLGNKYKNYTSRYCLSRSALKSIKSFAPDIVVVYPYQLIRVVRQLSEYHPIVVGPDCHLLGMLRFLKDEFVYSKELQLKYIKDLRGAIKLEQDLAKLNCLVAMVGKEDSNVFNCVTHSKKSFFVPHPHYGLKEKKISFDHAKLNVLITGGYDYATYTDMNKFCSALKSDFLLRENYIFTFIGKSWGPIAQELSSVCDVVHKEWVEDYGAEIIKHDIQIIPISNGVGTKGKTLDAMANGLLCIGSRYAMENVACEDGKSCLIYKDATEIVEILKQINANREKYVQIAERGRLNVRKFHSPELCCKILLKYYFLENGDYEIDKYLEC